MSDRHYAEHRWTGESSVMSIGSIFGALASHWRITALTIILGGLAGFGLSQLLPPVYTATATQLVKGIPDNEVSANYQAAQYAVSRARSYPALIGSLPVLEGVRSDTYETTSLSSLRGNLSATNPPDTPLVTIKATAPTAKLAAEYANSAARHMALYVTELETVDGKSPVLVETAVQAGIPAYPTSPQPALWTALGFVAGTAISVAIAILLTVLPPRGTSPTQKMSETSPQPSRAETAPLRPEVDDHDRVLEDETAPSGPDRDRSADNNQSQ